MIPQQVKITSAVIVLMLALDWYGCMFCSLGRGALNWWLVNRLLLAIIVATKINKVIVLNRIAKILFWILSFLAFTFEPFLFDNKMTDDVAGEVAGDFAMAMGRWYISAVMILFGVLYILVTGRNPAE